MTVTDVAMFTEGTYPYHYGGVSVWCDQLVRGMSGHTFQVTALVATGTEECAWPLPDNVTSLVPVPMWGPTPAGSKPGRRARPGFLPRLGTLVDVLLEPASPPSHLGDSLRDLVEYGERENLTANFTSEQAVRLFSDAWRERWPAGEDAAGGTGPATPTLSDALVALQLLEHSLRALTHPPVQADVLHAVTNGLGVLPALTTKWRYGTPLIVTEHGVYLREQYMHGRSTPYRWPVKALFLSFVRQLCALGYHEAEVITPGNVYNRRWEQRLGARPSSIRTVHNGVDPADFPILEAEPDAPTISWVGRVDPIKDLETLLRAFVLVHRDLPEARLRMFGSPPHGREDYLRHCRTVATELGIADVATFEGRVEVIRDAYAAGHVVVLCSISEGFPYSLIEAMTCGRACVATDVGGVTEAVGDTGLVVPPRNPDALAEACLSLLRDNDLRRRLAAAARARALEFFTVDRAINTIDEIYGFLGAGRPLPDAGSPVATGAGDRPPATADAGGSAPARAHVPLQPEVAR